MNDYEAVRQKVIDVCMEAIGFSLAYKHQKTPTRDEICDEMNDVLDRCWGNNSRDMKVSSIQVFTAMIRRCLEIIDSRVIEEHNA